MYKNVFSPNLGSNLAFIGFVQPATGGVLTMSETQARWFSQVCLGNVRLPPKHEMEQAIRTEKVKKPPVCFKLNMCCFCCLCVDFINCDHDIVYDFLQRLII